VVIFGLPVSQKTTKPHVFLMMLDDWAVNSRLNPRVKSEMVSGNRKAGFLANRGVHSCWYVEWILDEMGLSLRLMTQTC